MRGHCARLGEAWQELRAVRRYPLVVESLLGEAVTATVLLAATLKFEGKLTLQMTGSGLVPLLVAQCTHDFRVRAVAHHGDALPAAAGFAALVGDGRLVVTIEAAGRAQRYQGIVPLSGASMAECLESYFAISEQLPTRLRLSCDATQAAGLLLQKLPAAERGEASGALTQDVWEELQSGLASVGDEDLRAAPIETVLATVCGAHDCRLFGGAPLNFQCSCNVGRVSDLLRSIGEPEARDILAEQGAVTIGCEFCGREYRFDAVDVEQLFAARSMGDVSPRLN